MKEPSEVIEWHEISIDGVVSWWALVNGIPIYYKQVKESFWGAVEAHVGNGGSTHEEARERLIKGALDVGDWHRDGDFYVTPRGKFLPGGHRMSAKRFKQFLTE